VKRIGVLAGGFNPVTRAHLALVDAALAKMDEVVCVVPRVYPHKEFHGATLDERLEMLRRASQRYRPLVTEGGLFLDIARELRRDDPEAQIWFICGRDAAERIVTWDHGVPVERVFDEFQLLVAARQGHYDPPDHVRARIQILPLDCDVDEISSTEVRRRIAAGEPWEHLVPEPIKDLVERIYRK
jgi:nicotinate-nucleotide adenylyltransferase